MPVVDIADRGKSVAKTEDGKVIFVNGPVPGDVVDILLLRKKKGIFQGVVKNYVSYSKDRETPICSHFEVCGGCKWQHLSYKKQLEYKQNQVENALQRIAKCYIEESFPILGSQQIQYYRNKLEFSFSNKRWLTQEEIDSDTQFGESKVLGFHAPGSFDKIVPVEHCYLQGSPSNEIRNFIRDFTIENDYTYWDAREHKGLLRNMIVRTTTMGQVMVVISFSNDDKEKIENLLDALLSKFPEINSLNYVINGKVNDTMWDLEVNNYHGEKEIREKLGDVEFIISPKSFFQTNTLQSKRLYDIAVDFADFKGDENVLDLYTGIGSIALYIANKVKSVLGIELVPEAIIDAKKNAKLNGITNAKFLVGDVKDVLNSSFDTPDIVIVDPPREGIHKDLIANILQLSPKKIVYISCNPATQARDLALLGEKYNVLKSQAVDMFPHTHHIENVVSLTRKDK